MPMLAIQEKLTFDTGFVPERIQFVMDKNHIVQQVWSNLLQDWEQASRF